MERHTVAHTQCKIHVYVTHIYAVLFGKKSAVLCRDIDVGVYV